MEDAGGAKLTNGAVLKIKKRAIKKVSWADLLEETACGEGINGPMPGLAERGRVKNPEAGGAGAPADNVNEGAAERDRANNPEAGEAEAPADDANEGPRRGAARTTRKPEGLRPRLKECAGTASHEDVGARGHSVDERKHGAVQVTTKLV